MSSPVFPKQAWLNRCRIELAGLVPFCAPALYGDITTAELQAWAEGIWEQDPAAFPEVAAHRAMVTMLAITGSLAKKH